MFEQFLLCFVDYAFDLRCRELKFFAQALVCDAVDEPSIKYVPVALRVQMLCDELFDLRIRVFRVKKVFHSPPPRPDGAFVRLR